MKAAHRLDPLLRPESMALLGASAREGGPGHTLARMTIESGYSGRLYPINARYDEILGKPCHANLESLPESVDHVVIALGNERLEKALTDAAEHGARAATIFSSGLLEHESSSKLLERLRAIARNADMQVCGANGMGFYNPGREVYAGIFPRPPVIRSGSIAYIAQSGSAFTALCHNGCRLGFNLCVSTGNELVTSTADYMDWCLEQADTRVVGLFLETIRDPDAFVAALDKARRKSIPVVALKAGKSPLGAAMALTHSGAIAGNHAAFKALCRRHGVIEVDDLDEMAATLMLLQGERRAGSGGFAAIFESGGLRELFSDQAHGLDIDFAPLHADTVRGLQQNLGTGLKAENPLDAWDSYDRYEPRLRSCLELLVSDPNVGACAFVSNFRDGYFLSESIYRMVEAAAAQNGNPIALVNCYSDLANDDLCSRAHAAGIPIIDGAREALLAFRHLFAWRDFVLLDNANCHDTPIDDDKIANCRRWLESASGGAQDEVASLALLAKFGIPVARHEVIETQDGLETAARRLGFPLVLKCAESGINHKSDMGGVYLGLRSQEEVSSAYQDLCSRLGARAQLAEMIQDAREFGLGIVRDPSFGPVLLLSAGGELIELFDDRVSALCPLDNAGANRLLSSLKLDRLLDGYRGRPAADREALSKMLVDLSRFAWEFRDIVSEIDLNPVLVNASGATVVDALIVIDSLD